MTFNPMLGTEPSFNRPVETPNIMSAVVGLFGSVQQATAREAPSLTEGEKFQRDLAEFQGQKGAGFTWDRKGMREFIFRYPQHTDRAKSFGSEIGIMMEDPMESARDEGLAMFVKTPEGVLAAAQASTLSTQEEQEAFMGRSLTLWAEEQANLARIERERTTLEAKGSLVSERWNALAPTATDFTNNVISTSLSPILQDVMNGVTIEVPPEVRAQLGIRYNQVSMTNINAVLQDSRAYILKQHRAKYQSQFGEDALPPKEWEDRVMAPIDALIQIGNQVDSPQERLSAMNAIIGAGLITKLDKENMAAAMYVAENFPELIGNQVLGANLENMSRVIFDATSSSVFGTKQIATNIANASVEEAKGIANSTITLIGKELKPELFTAFTEAAKRSGYNVVDSATFETLVSKNLSNIKALTASDPEFRTQFSDWLYSDINQTVIAVQRAAGEGVSISFENGKYVAKLSPEARNGKDYQALAYAIQPEVFTDQDYINTVLGNLPEGLNLDTLNKKFNTLKLMGDVGAEVQDALGMAAGITNIQSMASGPIDYKVPEEVAADAGFIEEVNRVSGSLNIPSSDLLRIIEFETAGSWSPSIKNPNSTATGLIQFIESTARSLGTSTKDLATMDRATQMQYVEKYLEPFKGKIKNFGDLYMAIHWPAGVGKGETYVMYRKGSKEYDANKNLDTNGDGTVTRGETIASVIARTGNGRGVMTTPSTAASQQFLQDAAASPSGLTPEIAPVAPQGAATEAPSITQVSPQPESATAAQEGSQRVSEGGAPRRPQMTPELQQLIDRLGTSADNVVEFDSNEAAQAAIEAGKLSAGMFVKIGNKVFEVADDADS